MADKNISQFTAASAPLAEADLFHVRQGTADRKVTAETLFDEINAVPLAAAALAQDAADDAQDDADAALVLATSAGSTATLALETAGLAMQDKMQRIGLAECPSDSDPAPVPFEYEVKSGVGTGGPKNPITLYTIASQEETTTAFADFVGDGAKVYFDPRIWNLQGQEFPDNGLWVRLSGGSGNAKMGFFLTSADAIADTNEIAFCEQTEEVPGLFRILETQDEERTYGYIWTVTGLNVPAETAIVEVRPDTQFQARASLCGVGCEIITEATVYLEANANVPDDLIMNVGLLVAGTYGGVTFTYSMAEAAGLINIRARLVRLADSGSNPRFRAFVSLDLLSPSTPVITDQATAPQDFTISVMALNYSAVPVLDWGAQADPASIDEMKLYSVTSSVVPVAQET